MTEIIKFIHPSSYYSVGSVPILMKRYFSLIAEGHSEIENTPLQDIQDTVANLVAPIAKKVMKAELDTAKDTFLYNDFQRRFSFLLEKDESEYTENERLLAIKMFSKQNWIPCTHQVSLRYFLDLESLQMYLDDSIDVETEARKIAIHVNPTVPIKGTLGGIAHGRLFQQIRRDSHVYSTAIPRDGADLFTAKLTQAAWNNKKQFLILFWEALLRGYSSTASAYTAKKRWTKKTIHTLLTNTLEQKDFTISCSYKNSVYFPNCFIYRDLKTIGTSTLHSRFRS